MSCVDCGRDLHSECILPRSPGAPCCGSTSLCERSEAVRSVITSRTVSGQSQRPAQGNLGSITEPHARAREEDDLETRPRGRQTKLVEDLIDPESTGRKEAAKLYPLDRTKDCEWKGLSNCGGGKYPIVGCLAGKQSNRHHGPDKSTLSNYEGNVHRICARCHNLWHEWNDATISDIGEMEEFRHAPEEAEIVDLVLWDNKDSRPKAPNSRYKWHREGKMD